MFFVNFILFFAYFCYTIADERKNKKFLYNSTY